MSQRMFVISAGRFKSRHKLGSKGQPPLGGVRGVPEKLLFPVLHMLPAAACAKQGTRDRVSRLLNGPDQIITTIAHRDAIVYHIGIAGGTSTLMAKSVTQPGTDHIEEPEPASQESKVTAGNASS